MKSFPERRVLMTVTRSDSRWNGWATRALLHQPSSPAPRFTKTLTVNPESELISPTSQFYVGSN